MKLLYTLLLLVLPATLVRAQSINGTINDARSRSPLVGCTLYFPTTGEGAFTDANGVFTLSIADSSRPIALVISFAGYVGDTITIQPGKHQYDIALTRERGMMEEVVVTGTMKEISRSESPIPVEIITPALFRKNPTPALFEAVGMVNGVQPQLNCNVCNTGDIHINGMEGPYTMILIDGMPIVSSLSTVYGLNGIPNSIVERIEIVKGPAASLYGSEAMGGLINVITKNPSHAPILAVDLMATSWEEYNVDVSAKGQLGKASSLLGVNYYHYQTPIDKNNDGFTDVTLQRRLSIFNKWGVARTDNRVASLGLRYVNENRWGGQMNWTDADRGSGDIYGETIDTRRWEAIAMYQLPMREKVMLQFSYNWHDQNSFYGKTPYIANQQVGFAQAFWDKQLSAKHSLLLGASYRYTIYDDNTPATAMPDSTGENRPAHTPLPGVFIQDEWAINTHHKLLLGYRYDYDRNHGNIQSPRLAYKWSPSTNHTVRTSLGTGYRVVNLFTEDHAALTGAREVVITEALLPERSYNANLNYVWKVPTDKLYANIDATAFYTYFTNKIVGDFDADPNKIIYSNLNGYSISQGISLNVDATFNFPLKAMFGVTYMDVYQMRETMAGELERSQQLHAPAWSGTFAFSYALPAYFSMDLTGKFSGPMRLPILPNDYRPEYSPWFCIANIQVTKKLPRGVELYGGIKNLLDFVPKDPIMRAHDPFDKAANDPVNNPNGYTFDPSYNYAPIQGIRAFAGVRYQLSQKTRTGG